ncbi:unnamed protein product [Cuscuta epithymum]|uniref:Uncharacterized protein n=1 Tax=Cuscuta epithymum TaxID=186058 RepID=A0AAV0C514_9ASTE|nr:unnamed protein product [Cuscuta epithymum]CAH9136537.1 unnamed protein product [Cuscuta epithymum]
MILRKKSNIEQYSLRIEIERLVKDKPKFIVVEICYFSWSRVSSLWYQLCFPPSGQLLSLGGRWIYNFFLLAAESSLPLLATAALFLLFRARAAKPLSPLVT